MAEETNNDAGGGEAPGSAASSPKTPQARTWIAALVILVVLALIGGGYYYFFFKDGSRLARKNGENGLDEKSTSTPPTLPPPRPQGTSATPPPPRPVVRTDNWLRYQNSQYGFEIHYPPEWAAEASFGEVSKFVYLNPTGAAVGVARPAVAVELYPGEGTLQGVLKNFDYLKGEYRDIRVDGVPAKEITAMDQNTREVVVVVFAKNGVGYSLTAGGFGGTSAMFEVARKILSTFAFLD